MAQSNVYSLNVVGYVNLPIVGSASGPFTFIANPLNTTNNTIASLLPAPPDGTTLFKWTGSAFVSSTFFLGAWSDGTFTLNPGEGGIIQSVSPFTNTFVGEVLQGNLTNAYPAGFSIRSSKVPQAATLTVLGLPGSQLTDGDTVYQFKGTTQAYVISTWFLGAWGPSEPSIGIGESFWLQTAAAGNWVRNFTVQ